VTAVASRAGRLAVLVRRYDDHGKAAKAAGAVVHAAGRTATAGTDGIARLALAAGRHQVYADQPGRIRSFPVSMEVK
jgi:hypothetical protein